MNVTCPFQPQNTLTTAPNATDVTTTLHSSPTSPGSSGLQTNPVRVCNLKPSSFFHNKIYTI